MTFQDQNTAMKFRSVFETIVREVVDVIRPRAQYGYVHSWNESSGIAQILLAGDLLADDPAPIPVRFYPSQSGLYILSITDLLNEYAAFPRQINRNSDFEVDIEPWQGTQTNVTPVRSTAQSHSGAASILVTPNGINNNIGFITKTGDIHGLYGNTWYEFTGWVRCATTEFVQPRLQWQDSRDSSLGEINADVIPLTANTWTEFSMLAESPNLARKARISVRLTDELGDETFRPTPFDLLYGDELQIHRYYDTAVDPIAEATMVRVAGKPGNYYIDEVIRTPDLPTNKIEIQSWPSTGIFTYRKYTGGKMYLFETQAGGGAGGGSGATSSAVHGEGGGGGGGGYAYDWFTNEEVADEIELRVGAGGVGIVGLAGTDGESTQIIGYFGVDGGKSGSGMTPTSLTKFADAGEGGGYFDLGTGLPFGRRGGAGNPGIVIDAVGAMRSNYGGHAGSGNMFRFRIPVANLNTPGQAGADGSGGQGARTSGAGGGAHRGAAGGSGWIKITTYF